MKSPLPAFTFALLNLCLALCLRGESSPTSLGRHPGEIDLNEIAARVPANGDTVTCGTSRVYVSARLGAPSAVLSDGTWIFSGYIAHLDAKGTERDGSLVVRFNSGKVSSLTFADKVTVVALRQNPQNPANTQLLAVDSSR